MDRQEIIRELQDIIGDYLRSRGLELVDLVYRYEGSGLVLRILTDRPEGGINLDECSDLNIRLSAILDEKDALKTRYILEVSSPGLDRPLKTRSDFLRCVNKKAKFFLNEPLNGKFELDGAIEGAGDTAVYVNIEGKALAIPFSQINKAEQAINNA